MIWIMMVMAGLIAGLSSFCLRMLFEAWQRRRNEPVGKFVREFKRIVKKGNGGNLPIPEGLSHERKIELTILAAIKDCRTTWENFSVLNSKNCRVNIEPQYEWNLAIREDRWRIKKRNLCSALPMNNMLHRERLQKVRELRSAQSCQNEFSARKLEGTAQKDLWDAQNSIPNGLSEEINSDRLWLMREMLNHSIVLHEATDERRAIHMIPSGNYPELADHRLFRPTEADGCVYFVVQEGEEGDRWQHRTVITDRSQFSNAELNLILR